MTKTGMFGMQLKIPGMSRSIYTDFEKMENVPYGVFRFLIFPLRWKIHLDDEVYPM